MISFHSRFRQRFDKNMSALPPGSDPTAAMNEAKEVGLTAGPDPRALNSPDVDPLIVSVCRNPYAETRSRFLVDVESDCLRAMLEHAQRATAQAQAEAQAMRDNEVKKLRRCEEELVRVQAALEQEKSSASARAQTAKQELANAAERTAQMEEEVKAARKRAERAEADAADSRGRVEQELALRTRELQDALEAAKQHKQAANSAVADAQRLQDELATTRKMLEQENRTLREEFQTAGRKASEAEAKFLNMKEEARTDRERCAELERRMGAITETVTSQAQAIVALSEERQSVCDALAKKNTFLSQKADENMETLAYYEKIIAGNRYVFNSFCFLIEFN